MKSKWRKTLNNMIKLAVLLVDGGIIYDESNECCERVRCEV